MTSERRSRRSVLAVSEDWRVELDVEGHGGPRRLVDAARERTVARQARRHLGEGVVVSLDRDRLFAYAGTRELAKHRDAVALAKRLKSEGLGVLQRSRYVLVGAGDEDAARALAERLRGELSADAKVTAEGSEAYAWAELHRYSWLGGLGQ